MSYLSFNVTQFCLSISIGTAQSAMNMIFVKKYSQLFPSILIYFWFLFTSICALDVLSSRSNWYWFILCILLTQHVNKIIHPKNRYYVLEIATVFVILLSNFLFFILYIQSKNSTSFIGQAGCKNRNFYLPHVYSWRNFTKTTILLCQGSWNI